MRSLLASPWPRSVCLMVRARSWRYPSPSWNVEGPLCDIPFYSTYPRACGVCPSCVIFFIILPAVPRPGLQVVSFRSSSAPGWGLLDPGGWCCSGQRARFIPAWAGVCRQEVHLRRAVDGLSPSPGGLREPGRRCAPRLAVDPRTHGGCT